MNKKLTPLLAITLSLCWITTSSAMESSSSSATKKLIAVNEEFVQKHRSSFETFVASMELTKKALQLPFLGGLAQWGAQLTGYGDALKDINYLNRFFQPTNKTKQIAAIEKLFRDRDYQEKATAFLSDVFSGLAEQPDQSRLALLDLVHTQNAKTLRQPEGTTRDTLCQKVISGEISDEAYFESITLIIATIFVFENNLHK